MAQQNPYLNRVAIKDHTQFFGRRKEASRIFSRIGASRPQSISVVGDRRIGKSSLLNYLCSPVIQKQFLDRPENYVFVFMDLQQRRNLSLKDFLHEWLQQLQRALGTGSLTINGDYDAVRDALELLQARRKKLIAVFDEFDVVTTNRLFSADFFAFLRSLANNYEVAYITSSGRDLQELCHTDQIADSPFFNIFTNVYLRQFAPDEALELVTRPSAAAGLPLEPYKDDIFNLGGYFPFFLQIACSSFFEHLQDGSPVDRQAVEDTFHDEARAHFRYIWDHFDEEKHTVCRAIAENSAVAKEQTHVFQDLKRSGYVIEDAGGLRLFSRKFVELASRVPRSTPSITGSHPVVPAVLPVPELSYFEIPATDPAIDSSMLSGEITRRWANPSQQPPPQATIPAQIGRFLLRERIGGGGMGDVFLARDTELGRFVALKILKPRYGNDQEIRRRFLREARMASSLNHPNIATIYEIGEILEVPYLVMEYVRGRTLSQWVKEDGPMPISSILHIGAQTARALQEAHSSGIIHRDIKSSNLVVNKKGDVKVLDFGLAKPGLFHLHRPQDSLGDDAELKVIPDITEPGILVGTVTYMSPEQAHGEAEIGPASDIFSLGIVLYEITTGKLPFDGQTYFQTIEGITKREPKPIQELRPEAPQRLIDVINRALRKAPEDRFHSAAEMAEALEE
ncbi:MAG TPA: protein kinase [Acidobacteriota bacterium]|nr:protein kinase [Acidobacteriota bacterium]HNC43592.1 protein kinase [Acidobacteriota bacterium]HNH83441.1 protein kinase [Acidobacteriota bacterium]